MIATQVQKALEAHDKAKVEAAPKNPSGLHPRGVAVLVKVDPVKKSDSLLEIPETVSDRMRLVETRATVVEVGPHAWHDEPSPRAKPGDRVVIARFAGVEMHGTLDGLPYRMVNDRDIYCVIEEK